MNKPVLLVDTREKIPFDYSDDEDFAEVQHTKLDSGDYSIAGIEHLVSIERKKNFDELFINFTKDKKRILAEFARQENHKIKVIVIEQSCEDAFNTQGYYINKRGINKGHITMPVAVVMSNLITLMVEHDVHIVFAGKKAKSMIKRILLAVYKNASNSRSN